MSYLMARLSRQTHITSSSLSCLTANLMYMCEPLECITEQRHTWQLYAATPSHHCCHPSQ
jgi:hypothetical protein